MGARKSARWGLATAFASGSTDLGGPVQPPTRSAAVHVSEQQARGLARRAAMQDCKWGSMQQAAEQDAARQQVAEEAGARWPTSTGMGRAVLLASGHWERGRAERSYQCEVVQRTDRAGGAHEGELVVSRATCGTGGNGSGPRASWI
jgi:hypothetical protein